MVRRDAVQFSGTEQRGVRSRWTGRHHITTIDYAPVSRVVDFVPRLDS